MPRRGRTLAIVAAMLAVGCGPVAVGGSGCSIVAMPRSLPDGLEEASGAAVSATDPEIVWTHGDGGRTLRAVSRSGEARAAYRVDARLRDWEDLAAAPCPDGGGCLYLADTGDNQERRPGVTLLRLREPVVPTRGDPGPAEPALLAAERFPVHFPEGARDVEALAVLPGERVLLITKGRNHPVTVFRYPGALRADTVTLEEVQRLGDGPRILPRQVTGASARGDLVAVRTYESLRFYRLRGDTLSELAGGPVNLRILGEAQGEGVAVGPEGMVVLTSEAGPVGGRGSISLLRCGIPDVL